MPDYISVIEQRRKEIGMTICALAQKAKMDNELLGRTLRGKRKMTALELIMLSHVLGLTFDDYPNSDVKAV